MSAERVRRGSGVSKLVTLIVVVWLVIGAFAAYQRDYFKGSGQTCGKSSTILVTIVAGPLNYVGVNPKVKNCNVPQPSK